MNSFVRTVTEPAGCDKCLTLQFGLRKVRDSMLVRFSVENFLSFGPRWELDLRPTGDELGPDLGRSLPDGSQVLTRVLLCGAAGQGKSNLLKALSYLRQLLLHGNGPTQGHEHGKRPQRPQLMPCRLLDPPQPTTRFALTALCDELLFRYELAVRAEQIEAESLFLTAPGEPEAMVFVRERKNPILQFTDVKVGPGAGPERGLIETLAVTVAPEQPLVAEALASQSKVLLPLATWSADRLQLVRPEPRVTGLAARCAHHPDFAARLAELLRSVGLPVTQVVARKTPIGPDYFETEEEQRQVVHALLGYSDAFVQTHDGELIAKREGSFVDLFLTSLLIGMHGPTGRESDFSTSELSDSTLRLLHLSPLALRDAQHPSPVFVVDDLGRGLSAKVVAQLLDYPERPRDVQLLATALPDSELLGCFPPAARRSLPSS